MGLDPRFAVSWTPSSLPIRPQPIVPATVVGQSNRPAGVHAPELLQFTFEGEGGGISDD